MADALDGELEEFTIIKKKIKLPAGAHGGAWKVAYADFVTAMMAFFLLLWLLNASTEDQMTGLSDYFAPANIAAEAQGSGGTLAGQSIASMEGALRSLTSRPAAAIPLPTSGQEEAGDQTGQKRDDPHSTEVNKGDAAAQKEEQELLDEAMTKLRQSITQSPDSQDLLSSLQIEQTPEGLRLQLLDQDKKSMFVDDGAELASRARRLLALVGTIVASLDNSITITGHTRAEISSDGSDYGKWEISSDRAANVRQWLVGVGLPSERIIEVSGVADTDPISKKDPDAAKNSRVSIVITRNIPLPPEPTHDGEVADDESAPPELGFDAPPPLPDE